MSQPSVSMDLTASAVLSTPTQPSRAADRGTGDEFAAHLRQAGRDDNDSRSTRSARPGARPVDHDDDRTDTTGEAKDPADRPDGCATTTTTTTTTPAADPNAPGTNAQAAAVPGTLQPTTPTADASATAATTAPIGGPATSSVPTTAASAAAAAAAVDPLLGGGPVKSAGVVAGAVAAKGRPATGSTGHVAAQTGKGTRASIDPVKGGLGPVTAVTTTGTNGADAKAASVTTDASTGLISATVTTANPGADPAAAVNAGAKAVVGAQTTGVPTVSDVSAAASANATAAPAPTSNTPQASVAGQLAASLRTLQGREDGVHVMTVRLHPDELGPVRVVARLTGTDVHLTVTTSTVAAAEAVTAAGPRLHDALAGSGLTATGVNVDHDSGLAGQQPNPWTGGSPDAGAGGRPDGSHQSRGDGGPGTRGGRHRADVAPSGAPPRHPSARTLDLHV